MYSQRQNERTISDELRDKLTHYLRHGSKDGEQPSEARRSRPLDDGEQPSEAGRPRPLEHNSPPSESGSDPDLQEGEKKARKSIGETRGRYRTLKYLDRGRWVPAVYHESVRHYLIGLARKLGEYDHPRESGIEPDDVTSFLESQKSWGPERDKNWPEILYAFEKKDDHPDPTYIPKRWRVGTRLVLSGLDSLPLLDYRDIPATLSSALEGRDMEAIKRIDPRIKQRDFIARMPMKYTRKRGTRKSVQSATSIGMKMTRFRQKNGMLSWVGREGSQTIRDALWEGLPEWNRRNNSIRGLKPPTEWEQEKVREGNIGKFDRNAGDRALPEDVRNERKAKKQKRLQRLQGKEGEGRLTRSRAETTAATRAGNGKSQSQGVDRRKRHDTDERQPSPNARTRPNDFSAENSDSQSERVDMHDMHNMHNMHGMHDVHDTQDMRHTYNAHQTHDMHHIHNAHHTQPSPGPNSRPRADSTHLPSPPRCRLPDMLDLEDIRNRALSPPIDTDFCSEAEFKRKILDA